MNKINFNGENENTDCWCHTEKGLFLQACSTGKALKAEQESGEILALYDQLKLQKIIYDTPLLQKNVKDNLLYTNAELINQIAERIDQSDVDYPRTVMNLTSDKNTNTILNAIQNRKQHLNTNPNGYKNTTSSFAQT